MLPWKILKNLTPRNAFSCLLERKLSFSYHSSFTQFTTKNFILLSKNLFIQSSTVLNNKNSYSGENRLQCIVLG